MLNSSIVIGDITYEKLPDGSLSVKSYNGSAQSVFIPQTVEVEGISCTVTKIGTGAFEGNTALISIDLPNTISIIGSRAFKGCTNLNEMKTH